MSRSKEDGIAIVGIGTMFPGATVPADFFRNILSGRELIRDVPETYWLPQDFYDPDPRVPDRVYCKRGAFLDLVDFDPMRYGVPPKLLPNTDTCQLLALMVAEQVLRDALREKFEHVNRDRIGCILGVCSGLELVGEMAGRLERPAYVKVLRERGIPEDEVQEIVKSILSLHADWNESTFPGMLNNVVTGRITNQFDLGGPNFTTDAACASSFAAIAMAASMLRNGDADMVISGGADTTNDPFTYMCFSKTPALSMSSVCAPFSERADGMMIGEGLGMVALRRLADAERDKDRIYGVIRGIGSSSDGRAKSIYAPRWEGQVRAFQRAYEDAGFNAGTVEFTEAHGTGTKAGDQAEFSALREVFNESGRQDRQWSAIGSIKSQLGHTKATAGAAGLLKTVLALHHKVLPATLNVDKPAAKLEIETTPFYLNTETRPWIRKNDHPRRAAVSSFGFGGTNFHLVVEEYTGAREQAKRVRALPTELFLLSGDDRAGVAKSARALAAANTRADAFSHLAKETQASFKPGAKARLAIVVDGVEELARRLVEAADALEKKDKDAFTVPGAIFYSEQAAVAANALGFVFPGQGSQYVGMGADLAIAFDAARKVWDDEASSPVGGNLALHEVVFPRPVFADADKEAVSARLRATEWAQPSIGAVSASQLAVLTSLGLTPTCVAGHSFGELTALYASGSLDRASFLQVARARGDRMAEAAKGAPSGMSAVTAPIDQVEKLLASAGAEAVVANHNDPKQVVVSGTIKAIEEAERVLKEAGLKVQRLPVAAAFHSAVVAPSVKPFAETLAKVDFKTGSIPVLANATAAAYPGVAGEMRELLSGSIAKRVRFVDVIEGMYARGVRTFVEVGPGTALTGMVGRILGDRPHRAIPTDRSGRHGITSLWQSVAQLAVAGHPMTLDALWSEYDLGPDPRLQPKPKMTVRICGTNYGKAYPPPGGAAALPPPNPPRAHVVQRANGEVMETKDHTSHENGTNGAAHAKENGVHANGAAHANGVSGNLQNGAVHASGAHQNGAEIVASYPQYATAYRSSESVSGWLGAYEAIQARTAEAHAVYQQTMAQCHLAFLRTAEQSSLALASLAGGAPALPWGARPPALEPVSHTALSALAPVAWAPPPQRQAPPPVAVRAPARPAAPPAPRPVAHAPAPVAARAPVAPAPAPTPASVRPPAPVAAAPAPAPAPAPSAAPSAPPVVSAAAAAAAKFAPPPSGVAFPADGDLKTFLFSVVSEKTGYPIEILNLEQQLEADLGIDSIKRVEILSAFQDQMPDIKDVNLEEVTKLNTLGDVLGFMEKFADKLGLKKKAG